nr:TrxRFP1 thioredoxin biosensor [synthetic construct]
MGGSHHHHHHGMASMTGGQQMGRDLYDDDDKDPSSSMVKQIESKTAFQEALDAAGDKLVVVDFSATWCGPCKMIKPFFHSLSEKYSNVIFLEVDVDDSQDVASESEVKSMPTFQFFKKGQKVGEFSGANKEKLEATINELVGGSGGGGSGGGGSGGGGSGGGGSGGGGSGGELSCAISRLSSPVVSERMYPEDGALKSEIKKGLRLKDGGHYAAEVKTTYKAKKPVQLPGAYIVDIKLDIVSHNEDYTIVEQYERAEGRHSTGGMDELYKGGTGGSLVSKGEEDNMAIIKEFMRFKVHMEGSVNGHEFEIEGEGEGRPYEAFQTAKLKVTKGGPLPFAWDILSPQFMYGSKAYIKHPADIPDYFKLSFPEGFRWERVMNFEDGGIIHVNQDSSLQDGVFIYKVKLRGTNFPPDGPVMQKKTMGWEATRDQRCSSQA